MNIKKGKSQSDSKQKTSKPRFAKWRKEGNIAALKRYVSSVTNNAKTLLNEDFSEPAKIRCNTHPKEPIQIMEWKGLFRLLSRNSKTLKCPKCKQENLIRLRVGDYENRLSEMGAGLTLVRGDLKPEDKLNSKVKFKHRCSSNPEHPLVIATPYEIIFKNKKCAFCNPKVTFHKDFAFVKAFVEMDSDRIITNGGNFTLLTTKDEFEQELAKNENDLKKCRLKIKQKNCSIHNSFIVSWEDFAYRKRGCTECTRDANTSYAHRFFQALLIAYSFKVIPEFALKVEEQLLKTDFYLPTLDKHIEIDSSLHKKASALTKYDTVKLAEYQQRDKLKDEHLGNKLQRVILYEQDAKGNYIDKPTEEQLHIVKDVIRDLYKQQFNNELKEQALEEQISHPDFFKNARAQVMIDKLESLQGDHIVFAKEKHIDLISSNKQLFRCTHTNEEFELLKSSVLEQPFFLCPDCVTKAKEDASYTYPLNPSSITSMVSTLKKKHGDKIEFWNNADPFKDAIVYQSLVPKMKLEGHSEAFYIPLNQLGSCSTKKIMSGAAYGKYNSKEIIRSRESRVKKTKVVVPQIENREAKNTVSEKQYLTFHKAARLYSLMERNNVKNERGAELVLGLMPNYVHKTERSATKALANFEETILPFFEENQSFKLLTKAKQYRGQGTPLLIYHTKCKLYFFSDWAKIKSGIICQSRVCHKAYLSKMAKTVNKKTPTEILLIFKDNLGGEYCPKDLKEYKDMRTPITIIYKPTGTEFKASVDNWRRGKFKKPMQNLEV